MFTILIQLVGSLFVALALLMLPVVSFAANPVSKFNSNTSEPESSLEDAAMAALRLSAKKSSSIEYGGCLFKDTRIKDTRIKDTRSGAAIFHFTEPATNGSPDDFAISCDIPSGTKFVGLYHTHPRGSEPGISANDIEVARKLNVTSFVAFVDQRKIVSFTPGKTRTRCLKNGPGACPSSQRISDGDFVGPLR